MNERQQLIKSFGELTDSRYKTTALLTMAYIRARHAHRVPDYKSCGSIAETNKTSRASWSILAHYSDSSTSTFATLPLAVVHSSRSYARYNSFLWTSKKPAVHMIIQKQDETKYKIRWISQSLTAHCKLLHRCKNRAFPYPTCPQTYCRILSITVFLVQSPAPAWDSSLSHVIGEVVLRQELIQVGVS